MDEPHKNFINFQSKPLKLYIQDIYRAERNPNNKYIYQIFGLHFKNVMIHGVVTSMESLNASINFELSDPTSSILIHFDPRKRNKLVSTATIKDLSYSFASQLGFGNDKTPTLRFVKDMICEKAGHPIDFNVGSYLCVIGDIFVDSLRNLRMLAAYECNLTSVNRDIVWIEELKYLYEKYYLLPKS